MTFFEFFRKYNNTFVDVDQAFGPQCVDLVRQYCNEALNVPLPRGNAIDIFNAVSSTDKNFIKIFNSPKNVPRQGDIIFWGYPYGKYTDIDNNGKKVTRYAGHTGIVNTANILTFTSFDQNWPNDLRSRLVSHNNFYYGVAGWLRKR